MALRVNKGLSPYWYTPKEYEGREGAPSFRLQPLTQIQLTEVMSQGEMTEHMGVALNSKGMKRMLAWCLTDWQNVEDQDGKILEFSADEFDYLPFTVLVELANELITSAMLSEDERKNLQSQSRSAEILPSSTATPASGEGIATKADEHSSKSGSSPES